MLITIVLRSNGMQSYELVSIEQLLNISVTWFNFYVLHKTLLPKIIICHLVSVLLMYFVSLSLVYYSNVVYNRFFIITR
jgi:hypothetical protein